MSAEEREVQIIPASPPELYSPNNEHDTRNDALNEHGSRMETENETSQEGNSSTPNDAQQVAGPSSSAAVSGATTTQSTLTAFRTPVLPNLAQAALERIKKSRAAEEEEADGDDFQPLKKRKVVEEKVAEDDDNEV